MEEKVTSEVVRDPLERLMSGVFVVVDVDVQETVMFDRESVPSSVIKMR